ncbi:Outer membrane protein beta-barrel domain [Shewanella psychrophila]|uniref:Outer membrane protein beta-barrel domain n=1 Tax=Shewanella psychrophila TaxID=225848 RepID=A0A1S6HV28_9GAMM|nr:porin family protein [Shewanella psychrophila]AQS39417.1 Outer membrane protein beta-barrel domain [Shewanella psychrophila]
MKLLSIVIVSILSFGAVAGESNHIIGGNIGYGSQDFEADSGEKYGGGDSVGIDVYYRYMLNDNFGIEGSVFSGSGGIASAFTDILTTVNNISYKGVRAAIYGQVPLSESNSLYAKLGASANQLNYDVTGIFGSGTTKSIETDGTDFYGAVGWGIRFQSGLGLNLEYQYVPIQELIVQNFSIGMSYQF